MTPTLTEATPRCPHFGTCGGCQYQNIAYLEQLSLKRAHLEDLLQRAGVHDPQHISVHAAEPYHYRNRIRLRVQRVAGQLRLGYNIRSTTDFLPISTCPIAAPVLWATAESLLATAAQSRDAAHWLNAASDLELFTNHDQSRVQLTLFCAPRTKAPATSQPGHFASAFAAFQASAPKLAGASAVAFDPRTGPTGRVLAEAGAPGLAYTVFAKPDEIYWITRGGFFQVNRFLIETLVHLVCSQGFSQQDIRRLKPVILSEAQSAQPKNPEAIRPVATSQALSALEPRSGALAWDLFAGVGLFSRILARSFARITAVEANPVAVADLRSSLGKLSPASSAVHSTTLDFLHRAVLDRDRPDLIVLDPPRAGVGLEACSLLNRIAAPQIIYVSCDPATLARDLAALQPEYSIAALHLLDLFPQTLHLETVAILQRKQPKVTNHDKLTTASLIPVP